MNALLKRVTRSDVAKEAGTSVAVVSYVINGGPRPVAEATRQRVLAAIQKTGYRPNGIAKALVSGSTHAYGLILPNIGNPFLSSVAYALQQEAFKHGQVLLPGDSGDNPLREKDLLNNLLNRQIDGLLYTSVDRHPYIDLIQASGTPCVMLDWVNAGSNVSTIRVNERIAAFKVTQHLVQHGYRDIAIICGPLDMLNTQDRLSGWRDALTQANLVVHDEWVFPTEYTRQGGYDATLQMLKGKRPRALFATNELQAFGCLRALAEQGVAVPDDIALVCFNATQQSLFNVPSLTAVRQPVDKMARMAIEILRTWDGKAQEREFEFELQIGESCGCKPRS